MENFDRENIDELLEICQIRQYFPRQNFAPYGELNYVLHSSHLCPHHHFHSHINVFLARDHKTAKCTCFHCLVYLFSRWCLFKFQEKFLGIVASSFLESSISFLICMPIISLDSIQI